jgi:hypothetical protein
MLHSLKIAATLVVLGAALLSSPSYAAELTAADRAWIDTCISQRKASGEKPARLAEILHLHGRDYRRQPAVRGRHLAGAGLSARAPDVLEGRGAAIARRVGKGACAPCPPLLRDARYRQVS